MQFNDSLERSAELLRKALPLMSRQAAGLHPMSYAVWYAYVADDASPLRAEIDAHLVRHGLLDDAATEGVYRRHLAELDPVTAARMAAGVQRLLAGMSDTAAQASAQTQHFGQSLDQLAAGLGVDSSLGVDVATLDTLRGHTARMQDAMLTLQQRLADSQREIDQLRAEVQRVRLESLRDALTGLPNRRAFDHRLDASLATLAVVPDAPYDCLLMLDIDHFKHINDSYGHGFGDQVLRGVAQVLKALAPEPMLAARVGGEEFAVLMPAASLAQGLALAERLRVAVAASRVRRKDSEDVLARISVSLGVTLARQGDTPHSLVERADRALYASKAGGRDRVTVGQA